MAPPKRQTTKQTAGAKRPQKATGSRPRKPAVSNGGGPKRPMGSVPGTSFVSPPTAIGATSVGVDPVIEHIGGKMVRITGCDFLATATPLVSTWVTWANVAGMVLAPYAMGNNSLSDMARMYAEYRFDRLIITYVPSVGTTTPGHVAVYRMASRSSPGIDQNASSFLPYVLNQRGGAIGPVWQPLSVDFPCSGRWLTTVPLDGTDPDDEAEGEVFVATSNFAATGTSPSIGIIKITYQVSFREMTRNPRTTLIPLQQQYLPICLGASAITAAAGTSLTLNTASTDQAGNTAVNPTGIGNGDVYKFIIDITRSTSDVVSLTTIFGVSFLGTTQTITVVNNTFTVYLLYSATNWNLYSTYENAMTQSNPMVYAVGVTANTVRLRGLLSLIGSMGNKTQSTLS